MTAHRRNGTVFIAEDQDAVWTGLGFDSYFTGRFYGHRETATRTAGSFEDLSLLEALDWARERADRIVVRIGYGPSYAIGFADDELRAWPDGGLPEPERRRVPDEAWKDRTEADLDATWRADVALAPPAPSGGESDDVRLTEWDRAVADVAAVMGATWSADRIDGWFADARAAEREARRSPTGEAGWSTSYARSYRLELSVRAPTAARARTAGEALVPTLPDGWTAEVHVRFESS